MLFASPTAALAATFLVSFLSFHSVSARPTDRFAVRASNTKAATLATDGKSAIVDLTTTIKNVPLRFKVSAPPEQYLVPGNTAAAAGNSSALPGLNVLLHGDGGQSFIDFPNQALQGNLMGVVVLAPNKNRFWGGGSGLQRTDGALHSELVNSLIKDVLPTMLAFDQNNVQFTGVSGGSLLLSGFFLPAFASQYTPTNVLLNCGGLAPQVTFVDAAKAAPNLRIHYQSTKNELTLLKGSIPTAIQAYEKAATSAGVTAADLNKLQTANAAPNGGHCEFDGKDFVSGVQLMSNSFNAVFQGNGQVSGIGSVTTGVVGKENLFGAARATGGGGRKQRVQQ